MNEGAPIIIKKKKVSGHGHHGGAWKVAYADFVTAMMAFFLVMWIMGLSDADKAEIERTFNEPRPYLKAPFSGGLPRVSPTGDRKQSGAPTSAMMQAEERDKQKDEDEVREVQEKVNKILQSAGSDKSIAVLLKNILVTVSSEGLELEFAEGNGVVFFEVGSSVVRPAARKIIQEVAPVLGKSGRRLIVDGHTDSRAYSGPNYDNFDLSADRAQAVLRILRNNGVQTKQIMGCRGFGDQRLKYPGQPLKEQNRRVTVLLPFKRFQQNVKNELGPEDYGDKQGAFRKPVDISPEGVQVVPPKSESPAKDVLPKPVKADDHAKGHH